MMTEGSEVIKLFAKLEVEKLFLLISTSVHRCLAQFFLTTALIEVCQASDVLKEVCRDLECDSLFHVIVKVAVAKVLVF